MSGRGREVGCRLCGRKGYQAPSQQPPVRTPSGTTELVRVAQALQVRIAKSDLDLASSPPVYIGVTQKVKMEGVNPSG